jgi:hypothetical protein
MSARHAGRWSAGAVGVLGSMACTASMIAAAVGVGGAAAATSMTGMTGMTGTGRLGGVLGVLVRIGPWLIVASVLLVTAAFALSRRPVTAIPALAAGAVLYAGMYAQNSLLVMYASIAVGYLTWAALALWVARNPAAQHTRPHARGVGAHQAGSHHQGVTHDGQHPGPRGQPGRAGWLRRVRPSLRGLRPALLRRRHHGRGVQLV